MNKKKEEEENKIKLLQGRFKLKGQWQYRMKLLVNSCWLTQLVQIS